jgi:hypothetical protein
MKRFGITAGVLAVTITTSLGAQSTPAGTVVKPSVNAGVAQTVARPSSVPTGTLNTGSVPGSSISSMAAGRYQLALHAQKRNGGPITVAEIDDTVVVARSGSGVTISADSMSLTGTASGTHFTASGAQSGGPALSLSGTSSTAGSATGTFSLQRGPNSVTGTFTMSPVPVTAQAHDVINRPPGGHGGGTTSCDLWCKIKNLLGL